MPCLPRYPEQGLWEVEESLGGDGQGSEGPRAVSSENRQPQVGKIRYNNVKSAMAEEMVLALCMLTFIYCNTED